MLRRFYLRERRSIKEVATLFSETEEIGRYRVRRWFKKAGIEIKRKSAMEVKGLNEQGRREQSRQKLKALFGEDLDWAIQRLTSGETTISQLALMIKVDRRALAGYFRNVGIENPKRSTITERRLIKAFGQDYLTTIITLLNVTLLNEGAQIKDLAAQAKVYRCVLSDLLKRNKIPIPKRSDLISELVHLVHLGGVLARTPRDFFLQGSPIPDRFSFAKLEVKCLP